MWQGLLILAVILSNILIYFICFEQTILFNLCLSAPTLLMRTIDLHMNKSSVKPVGIPSAVDRAAAAGKPGMERKGAAASDDKEAE